MHYSVVIVGAGPAGLSCAKVLAGNGKKVLVLERKKKVGPKVCAGGITWSGLIDKIPGHIEEKRFPVQHIVTRFQHATIKESEPIIATVNRESLGLHMAEIAREAGAEIRAGCQVRSITPNSLSFVDKETGAEETVEFEYLVGADGSSSLVRRYLGLNTDRMGVGINYQVPGDVSDMEWHLDSAHFQNGYGWIFPHSDTVSIGAYVDATVMPAKDLKKGLLDWAKNLEYDLTLYKPSAEYINFDYRGWDFGRIFLAGDAAGFASGLTGEGIYPAIVSGENIGSYISLKKYDVEEMSRLVRMQNLHARVVKFTGKASFLTVTTAELVTFGLRMGILDFRKLEMAH